MLALRTQKITSAALISLVVFGGFEALLYILNLNQAEIFFHTAVWVFLYLAVKMVVLFDLHFKNPGSLPRARLRFESVSHWLRRFVRVVSAALWERIEHLRRPAYVKQLLVYVLLPGFIFWATVAIFYVNFGNLKVQQLFVLLSGLALVLNYWYLKEIFLRRKEVVDSDVFVVMTVVKIYASALLYAAMLAMARRYCLDAGFLMLGIFAATFLLVYQALFQHRLVNQRTLSVAAGMAAIMALLGYGVLIWWGYNFYTAAIFLTACYNLLWGVFHYHLDHVLTKAAFLEILAVTLLIAGIVISATNFRAQILDACQYSFGSLSSGYFNR